MANLTRRHALGLLGAALPASRLLGDEASLPIANGPFRGTVESLSHYEIPQWFRDAKFGIWAHWGPQSAPEQGDWYARRMYIQGEPQYQWHVENFGHPSEKGFKDVIPTWKGDKFDAEHLLSLYKQAGAKYFFSMGVHHDNFDMWNSKHTRWNAVNMGPKQDIVGLFARAARNQGLRFGVSEHLWITYKWFSVSHWADQTGPKQGVPYDGVDPANADLYCDAGAAKFAGKELPWNADGIPDAWKRHWFDRIQDLVDQHQPDLLYTDGAMPFGNTGASMVAHLYNVNARRHGGKTQAVYFSKRREDAATGASVLDVERGLVNGIWPTPWQTDTCIGDWHYKKGIQYKSPKTVIDLLVDIVSRNGNLLLNFPLPNSGELDPEERAILVDITRWMRVNSEAIYATRPWKTFGEGSNSGEVKESSFNEKARAALGPADIRYVTKGSVLYAFVMGWPEGPAKLPLLGTASAHKPGRIANVELLGHAGKLKWSQTAQMLQVALPPEKPSDHAVAFRVTFG